MDRMNSSMVIPIVVGVFFWAPLVAQAPKNTDQRGKGGPARVPAVLWHEPADITTRDLLYGQGGKEHEPKGGFKFIEEDMGGSNPKFKIEDEQGIQWKVKLGVEAQPETVATRLLWAVGYFADEDYYLRALRVEGMRKLKRGQNLISAGGTMQAQDWSDISKGKRKLATGAGLKIPLSAPES